MNSLFWCGGLPLLQPGLVESDQFLHTLQVGLRLPGVVFSVPADPLDPVQALVLKQKTN